MDAQEARAKAMKLLSAFCKVGVHGIEECLALIYSGNAYRIGMIPKRSGKGRRKIFIPDEYLKKVLGAILKFLHTWPANKTQFAFKPGLKSPLRENALSHTQDWSIPKWILKIDLRNAFPSVDRALLEEMLEKMLLEKVFLTLKRKEQWRAGEITKKLASLVATLVTTEGRLEQGAPTSPHLFNLAMEYTGVVSRLLILKGDWRRKRQVSIYADDITISTREKRGFTKRFIREAIRAIEEGGRFKVNREKTKVNAIRHKAHRITGVSLARVGERRGMCCHLTLPQKKLKAYRGKIHRAIQALESGRKPTKQQDGVTLEQVRGYVNWIKSVCGERPSSIVRKTIIQFEFALRAYRESIK